jgi:hypothetical protein
MMLTDRENEILDEHFREWFADGQTPDRDEVIDNLNERIRETDDEPELQAELSAILDKYLDR